MSSAPDTATAPDEVVLVSATDLPLYCPGPKAPLWSMHPRVYIELEKQGSARCPYCSTRYQLEPGTKSGSH